MAGPKEQPLPPDVIGREDATEVLRAFVLDGGLSIAFTRAFEEPEMWGLLLVDIARHAALAKGPLIVAVRSISLRFKVSFVRSACPSTS